MNPNFIEARDLIAKAREALRRGDKPSAWKLGEQAALLAPAMEDVWLILAAADSNPEESLAYARKALEINPSSTRARKGVEWAKSQMRPKTITANPSKALNEAPVPFHPQKYQAVLEAPQLRAGFNNRNLLYAASFLGLLICIVGIFAAYSAVSHPAFASILSSKPVPTQENLWAPMEIAKPSITPINGIALAQQLAETPTPKPTRAVSSSASTGTPTDVPTEAATSTPAATETPGVMAMQILVDTPTSAYVAPIPSGPLPEFAKSGNGVRWIDVDLTNQAVYAYEGDVIVNSFIVSTGTARTPTVTGKFKIYIRLEKGNMRGPGYFLPDVPYIMYFHKSYGLHGTYWHNNFGTPMSHGCVNLRTADAAWLYNWSALGTVVNVHY